MKNKINNFVMAALTISGIIVLLSGCASTSTPLNTPVIQTSVDPIVTNILTSLNNSDYSGFSQNFSQTMKNAINQSDFDILYSQMQTEVGDYQSDVFYNAANKAGAVNLVYFAQYSKEPAGISVSLTV